MLLVLLQNGWSRYYERIALPGEIDFDVPGAVRKSVREKIWSRESWIDATWACKTGRVLRAILRDTVPDDEIWLDDTTLELSRQASGKKPPSIDHITSVLYKQNIQSVLACGAQAGEAIDRCWRGPLVKMPHPAYRGLDPNAFVAVKSAVATMRTMGKVRSLCRVAITASGMAMPLPGDITGDWDAEWITRPDVGDPWAMPGPPANGAVSRAREVIEVG